MQSFPFPVLLITAALCGITFLAARSGDSQREHEIARLGQRLDALAVADAVSPATAPDDRQVDEALAEMRSRIARLESSAERRAIPPEAIAATETLPVPVEEPAARSDPARRKEFMDLFAKVIGADSSLRGTLEEQERFFALARESGIVDDILAELEARVAANPSDLDARMELSQAYTAKLMTVPGGPEQGIWGARAEEQWAEVAQRDPARWDAHFALGNNFSYYPDFMNKTGEAIASLERALEIQRTITPEPAHVQTYLSLARMYERKGKTEQARTLLQSGLHLHPGDAGLAAALADLEG